MSEAKDKIQNFLENMTQFATLDTPQSYKNLIIIPLILKDDVLDFITIKKAEEAEIGFIQEIKSGEQVATLQAVNQGTTPLLIPYMQVVQGGKQDRTIYEPILVAPETTIDIPSKCIEKRRWSYRSHQESKSKRFKTSPMKMTIGIQAKAIRAPYRKKAAQSEVWESIEMMSNHMALGQTAAPTRSGIQMQETQNEKLKDYSKHFKLVKNQAGMIGLVNNQVIAFEIYGNPAAFKDFWKDILNSFAMEGLLRLSDNNDLKTLDSAEIHERTLHCFEKFTIQYTNRRGVGLGTIIEFADQNLIWAGIALVYENKFAHFYAVGKSIFLEQKIRTQRLRVSQLRRHKSQNYI
ncbi:MAG: ARPP-1 family domain-containing protein [Promethearchaeota archaeon]